MDDRDLDWYLEHIGCGFVRQNCTDCRFRCMIPCTKDKIFRELRNEDIVRHCKEGIKPSVLAFGYHLTANYVRNIVGEYNKRDEG